MAIKKVVFFSTLLRLAREESDARASGDEEQSRKAAEAHEAYRQACLIADEMVIGPVRQTF